MWQTSGIRNCRQVKDKANNLKTETQMRKGRLSPKYCSDQSKENMRFFSSHFSEILAGHWAGCLVAWFKLFKYFCCISIVFPMYFQFISIVFPLYFHCISIVFPSYFHCILITFLLYSTIVVGTMGFQTNYEIDQIDLSGANMEQQRKQEWVLKIPGSPPENYF